jgi:hypothetical protein
MRAPLLSRGCGSAGLRDAKPPAAPPLGRRKIPRLIWRAIPARQMLPPGEESSWPQFE